MAWICLNDAFFSIVNDGQHAGCLVVRARRKGDIEKVFPGVKVRTLRGRDYQFRAHVKREVVADAIRIAIMDIDYSNFKGSVDDPELHSAYQSFWHIHARLQPVPPYRM